MGILAGPMTLSALCDAMWPAAGFVDTQFGCFMKREVENAKTQVQ